MWLIRIGEAQVSRTRYPLLLCIAAACCGPQVTGPAKEFVEPAIYASAICDAMDACGCLSVFASQDECEREYRDRLLRLMESGLEFDDECFEEVMGSPEFRECSSSEDGDELPRCTVLQGTKREGEACTHYVKYVPPFFVDECEGESSCGYGRCRPSGYLPPYSSEGDSCFVDDAIGQCRTPIGETRLHCGRDEICYEAPLLGESCKDVAACTMFEASGYYCHGLGANGVGVCTASEGLGDACDPRDVNACFSESGLEWCDPSGTCVEVESVPRVCVYTQDPFRFLPRG